MADVPPTPRRIPLPSRVLTSVVSSKLGTLWVLGVARRVDPPLLKLSKGHLSSLPGAPVLLLRHTGAKSGETRETPLVYARDGEHIVLIASMGGAPRHPAWYHNLVAHPECEVVAAGRSGRYRARQASGEERARLWEKALDVYIGYQTYQERAGRRVIPVMVLEPV
jgi:deazaflavin-dependent oxidoreductase (nitroreductase family)